MEKIKEALKKKSVLITIIIIFIISRLSLFVIAYLSNLIIIKDTIIYQLSYLPPIAPSSTLDLFFKWDSLWYMNILQEGYSYNSLSLSNVAFFPLYPILVKIFSFGVFNYKIIGYIISNIALFIACIYLYKLTKLDYDKKTAINSVLFMLIFPVSFFFSIFYTEGLFLALAISCFYYARKKRWLIVSILGFFLSLTRVVGVIILIPILMEYFDLNYKNLNISKDKVKKDILYLLLIPAGLLCYMGYLYLKFGDALAFLHIQERWERKVFSSILETLNSLKDYIPFFQIIFVGFIIFAVLMIAYLLFSKARLSYVIYSLILLYFYLSASKLDSIIRYISIIFPIYISLALIANKNRLIELFLVMFSIIFLTIFTILFVCGYLFV